MEKNSPLLNQVNVDLLNRMKDQTEPEQITQGVYLQQFSKILDEMMALTKRKNSDYAGTEDAMKNFKGIEFFTNGRITVADGIVVRMTDKLQRIANLLTRENQVIDESILDTCRDLAVYSIILEIAIKNRVKV